MSVKLFVEGGGDSKELRARCREAFRKLLEKAGFIGRLPRIVACGGRSGAFDDFCTALRVAPTTVYPMLLVDSESPVESAAWAHLGNHDGWQHPAGVADDQAQLMVTCMETWVLADRSALKRVFGKSLRVNALLPESELETRTKDAVQQCLELSTRDCGRDHCYRKGRRSFQVVGELDPAALQKYLPHFRRLLADLDSHLPAAR